MVLFSLFHQRERFGPNIWDERSVTNVTEPNGEVVEVVHAWLEACGTTFIVRVFKVAAPEMTLASVIIVVIE